jgi:hypothetical protein
MCFHIFLLNHTWNVGLLQRDYTALYSRTLLPSYTPPWECEILRICTGILIGMRGTYCFYLQCWSVKMEAVCSLETLLSTDKCTRHYYAEEQHVARSAGRKWLCLLSCFSADGNYEVRYKSNVLIYPNGEVLWVPPAIYQVNTLTVTSNMAIITITTTHNVLTETCRSVFVNQSFWDFKLLWM